jgi:MarR family transcriptional regulator, temperature-dependent positive regulator of motility
MKKPITAPSPASAHSALTGSDHGAEHPGGEARRHRGEGPRHVQPGERAQQADDDADPAHARHQAGMELLRAGHVSSTVPTLPGAGRRGRGSAYNARRSAYEQMHAAPNDLDLSMLRELSGDPLTSQRNLAQRLGVSLGRVNYCLRALTQKGWIKANNFRRSDNKWGYAYVLTPAGVEGKLQLTRRFLQRKVAEYDQLRAELEALRREVGALQAPQDTEPLP